ncbi:helix-turn-helix domain-containing protein [Streptomyces acidiscabies]|uniref:Helix-turn-helix transcriptional regulator n=1 Tax=Streptomyces acidiscabies TaxID=42234 RepID=A0AAP6EEM0_9ACTN|nr:helix-turn-helix transcriptional regulator [Streptomyces acidiscabies]MBP5939686.1 helix-turn-helix domain-containing protein [Streptomyces sp. LBUM 1476]MBZ3910860.1 helix-turn-helix transcriptional regulator [Streptomyces acidiscabies]MDX2959360.1 helix-turn-helix transcriptional regulator [Streptomyces acidiscabies]MDX3017496.1 helix-turn-helix transcriptional regulator [Streptomyces acidiscabies]MDX3787972.1 helix-turn-helix transcriptional regulator [Streptomyces acidiscabies]
MNRKELDPEGSPSAKFGIELRRLRDARGWTQDDLAARAGCSATHISAVETGRRPPTPQFAASLDRVFGTGDMLERMSRSVRHTALIEGFPEYLAHEARAAEVRLYEVGVIPGLLQTPEYAAALEADAVRRAAITPEQAQERVELVARRQASLVRMPSPLIIAVLDEGCILRPMGTAAVMDAQYERLLAFAELPHTVFQIAPFSMGARRPFSLPVTLLTLPDRSILSYAESTHRGHLERESTFVLPILAAYHQLQAEALSQAESAALIRKLRKGTP